MRLSNVVIGFLLAIALAYVHDATVSPLVEDGRPQTLVNWDVMAHVADGAVGWARAQLGWIGDQLHRS